MVWQTVLWVPWVTRVPTKAPLWLQMDERIEFSADLALLNADKKFSLERKETARVVNRVSKHVANITQHFPLNAQARKKGEKPNEAKSL